MLFCCFSQHLFAQLNNDSIKRKIEKFNIEKLYQFKAKNKVADTLADGSIVIYFDNAEIIQETIKMPNSVYKSNRQYFKDNLSLKKEELYFYDMPVGTTREYDPSGKLIMEVDYDSIFKYSLNDLSKNTLQNYSIDLFRDKHFGIMRHIEDLQNPYYELLIYSGGLIRVLIINGITGKIISDTYTTIKK